MGIGYATQVVYKKIYITHAAAAAPILRPNFMAKWTQTQKIYILCQWGYTGMKN